MSSDALPPYAIVVDDDEIILLAALDILDEAGFRTLMASSAEEAVIGLEAHGLDVALLFTDVEMPGAMDGFALAHVVATRRPEIGILVSSGNRQPGDNDLPSGAIFVAKPFSADVVHERVNALLPNHRKPEPLRKRMS